MKFLHFQQSSRLFPSSKIMIMLYLVLMAILRFHVDGGDAITLPGNETVPAVFVFGDSIVDPGNNNNLKTQAKANYPPYGRDFSGSVPTGRFSNGKIPPDIIAELLGVKDLVPPYLDPNLQPQDLITGVSFASGGAGYDPLSATLAPAQPISDQVRFFKEALGKIKAMVGEERTATILSKSFFLVCFGSNDISNTYFGLPVRRLHYDLNAYADFTASFATSFFEELYSLGARRIGVISVPPIGCVPSQRTVGGGPKRECYEGENLGAQLLNSRLSSSLKQLNAKYPEARFVFLDIYQPLLSLIQDPSSYGFEVWNRGCCGTGYIEVTLLCTKVSDPITCKDDTKYIFWDSFHPTERTYNIIATGIIEKYLNDIF